MRSLVAAAVLLTAAGPIHAAPGQAPVAALHLLDVPFLPQSELLCGGAAAAMVLRYWGATNIYAESFADLVDPAAGGIRGDDLLRAVRSRGWSAESFRGDRTAIQEALRARHPVIVLIEDRPGRFHYVVVVGWSADRVIVHDPARAPFRVIDADSFEASWKASNYWAVAPVPLQAATTGPPAAAPKSAIGPLAGSNSEAPCAAMVDEGVRLAGAGDVSGARKIFEVAADSCPDAAGPWREMAGLHVLGSDWPAAAADARKALEREPADALAARILATALFLENDSDGALAAWNRVGEPLVDLIKIAGLERTRYAVAAGAIAVRPQTTLTPGALRDGTPPACGVCRPPRPLVSLSRRRKAGAPVSTPSFSNVHSCRGPRSRSAPSACGRSPIENLPWTSRVPPAVVSCGVPRGGGGSAGRGSRSGSMPPRRSVVCGASASSVSGRHTDGRVRCSKNRGAAWRSPSATGHLPVCGGREASRSIGCGRRARTRAARRWRSPQPRSSGSIAIVRLLKRAWGTGLAGWRHHWSPFVRSGVRKPLTKGSSGLHGQVRIEPEPPPRSRCGLVPGQGRDAMCCCAPTRLLDHGIVGGESFGRQLLHGGVEARRWVQLSGKPVRLAPALFVDAARASHGLEAIDTIDGRWQFDAGAGIRLAVPGSGVLRIDVAHGLRDGRTAFSIGWVR